jgi:hypothetical protein
MPWAVQQTPSRRGHDDIEAEHGGGTFPTAASLPTVGVARFWAVEPAERQARGFS